MSSAGSLGFITAPLALLVLPLLVLVFRDLRGNRHSASIAVTGLEYLSATRQRHDARRRLYRPALFVVMILWLGLLWAGPELQSREPLFLADAQTRQKNMILAIDVSRSMSGPLEVRSKSDRLATYGQADTRADRQTSRYEAARETVYSIVERFPAARIGLILFSTEPFLARWPTTETGNRFVEVLEESLTEASELRRFSSLTNTDAALMLARDVFARQASARGGAVVYISDAEDEMENMALAIRTLRDDGIRLYAIGVGISESIVDELAQGFAGDPGFRVFRADSEEQMRDAYRLISELEEAPRYLAEERAFVTRLRGVLALGLALFAAGALWLLETGLHRTQVAGPASNASAWHRRVLRNS